VSAPMLDAEFDLAAAKDILARLERYAASVRSLPRDSAPAPVGAPPKHPLATTTAAPVDSLPAKVPWKQYGQPAIQPLEFPPIDTHIPRRRRARIDPATADLFPYDLTASIVACAVTIVAYVSFGRPVAVAATIALAVAGEWMRRVRWFPSIGGKLLIGTAVGLLLVFTA
jgi:hypothetical protein